MPRLLKALLLIVHLAWGLLLAGWLAAGRALSARERLAQRWYQRLLRILGLQLQVEGASLEGPHVTVANHVSWLDIPVLGALEPTRFISKSEVREWPVAGALATAAGTFFLRRGKGGAAPLLERLVPHLRAGGSVVLFPEGTTSDGTQVLPFHPRLFAAAIESQLPVQPVTVCYEPAGNGENIAPFVGDDSLVAHVLRLLRTAALRVRVVYGPPIRPTLGRNELAREAESFVRAALPPPRAPRPPQPAAISHRLRAA